MDLPALWAFSAQDAQGAIAVNPLTWVPTIEEEKQLMDRVGYGHATSVQA